MNARATGVFRSLKTWDETHMLWHIVPLIIMWALFACSSLRADDHLTLAKRVSRQFLFHQAIVWIGSKPPPDAETRVLWQAIEQFRAAGTPAGLAALEAFVQAHPDSAWTPSVRSNLAEYYRDIGRLTPALEHWEQAWEASKHFKDGQAKEVADLTLAHWTRLLAALGRKQQLLTLLDVEGRGRAPARGALAQMLSRTSAGLNTMLHSPGLSYRCGSLALYNVGLALKGSRFEAKSLLSIPSPETGFSLASLRDLSQRLDLGVIPVKRSDNTRELVVPSVIHWRQGHYAALTKQSGSLYHLVDPTFGRNRLFDADIINSEASGYFLVPADQVPDGWQRLTDAEAAQIFGRGFPADMNDEEDEPCESEFVDPAQPNGFAESPGGRIGADGPNGSDPDCDDGCGPSSGMPNWRVSEPFITLWLEDEPLGYQPSRGPRISFRVFHKQRETRPDSPYIFGFGDLWNSSFLSYLKILDKDSAADGKPPYSYYEATLYVPGGGERYYTHLDEASGARDNRRFTRLERIADANGHTLGYRLLHPRGSEDVYRYLNSSGVYLYAYLTERIDRYGNRTRLNYAQAAGQTLLTSIEDVDGQITTFGYAGNRIVQINAPDGRTAIFSYDSHNRLASITDAAGIVSFFGYAPNISWVDALTTPYGTTRFSHFVADLVARLNPTTGQVDWVETGGGNRINRAITITQPDGSKQLYLYREQSARLNNQSDSPVFMASAYPSNTVPEVPNTSFENDFMETQNSFHWNARQHAALSTTVMENFSVADYNKARLKHWIRMANQPFHSVGGVPSLIREPSPDSHGAVPGQMTWITYNPANDSYGTAYVPSVIARKQPDGSTAYIQIERNHRGLPTRISSPCTFNGQPVTRFTDLIYAPNGIDLLEVRPPGPFQSYQPTDAFEYNTRHQVVRHLRTARFIDHASRVNETDRFTYDSSGRLSSITKANGITTTFSYNSAGRLSRIDDSPISRVNTFSYYSNGLPYSHTDERGLTRWFAWDNLQRLVSISFSSGGVMNFRYTLDNELRPGGGLNILHLTGIQDRLGYWTRFNYNSLGQMVSATDAAGRLTRYSWCSCDTLESVVNALNQTTRFFYDNAGRHVTTLFPDNTSLHFNYNSLGQLTGIRDTAGAPVADYTYNLQGLLSSVNRSNGQLLTIAYDLLDRPVSVSRSNSATVTFSYDNQNRVVSRSVAGSNPEAFEYSAQGLTAFVNALGQRTSYSYDLLYHRLTTTNDRGDSTYLYFNSAGDLTSLLDPKGQLTSWNYDSLGRVLSKADSSGTILSYSYDANDRLISRSSYARGTTLYSYDAVGNLTYINYPSSTDVSYAYDALNRLIGIYDGNTGSTTFTYNSFGWLQTEDGPWTSDAIHYTYDQNRRRSALSLPSPTPFSQTYTYDSAWRLQTIASPAGSFTYSYLGASSLVGSIALPNGATILNNYDAVGRLASTTLRNNSSGVLNSHGYTYNAAHQRTRQARSNSFVDYAYDGIGQLTYAYGYESSGAPRWHERLSYIYDSAGNLIQRANNALTQTFSSNTRNQLNYLANSGSLTVSGLTENSPNTVSVNGQAADLYADGSFAAQNLHLYAGSYTATAQNSGGASSDTISLPVSSTIYPAYDGNGNLYWDGQKYFYYDDEDRLVQVQLPNAWRVDYAYDGLSRRRWRRDYVWNSSGYYWQQIADVRYLYDGNLVLQERDAAGNVLVTYTRGIDLSGGLQGAGGIGGILARTDPSSSAFYHSDGSGNVTALINASQQIVARYLYDPFGNLLGASGPLAQANLYRFSSKEYHPNANLYYYGFRYYEPNLQRWINRDPIGESGGVNLYQFVANDPLNLIDPLGLVSLPPGWGGPDRPYDPSLNPFAGPPPCRQDWVFFFKTLDDFRLLLGQYLGPPPNPTDDEWKQMSFLEKLQDTASRLPMRGGVNFHRKFQTAKKGQTVLGKFPKYLELADDLGAKRFNIPTAVWNRMTKAEQWAANQRFLDRAIARGDDIILATPVKNLNDVTGAFRQELDYLIGKGFRLSSDGSRLIK